MRKLFSVLVGVLALAMWLATAQGRTAPKGAVKILSWCHSPVSRAVVFVVDQPGLAVKWQYSCRFTKGRAGNRSVRSRSRRGVIRVGKWGFNYRLYLLWAGKGYSGSCSVSVNAGGRVWRRKLRFGRCVVPRTTSIRARISRMPLRRGRYKRAVVRVRTAQAGTLVKWHWKCRYRKGSSTNGSVSTKSKSGQFKTGKYRFKAKWHLFGTWWKRFTGGCRLTYQVGHVKKVYRIYFGRPRRKRSQRGWHGPRRRASRGKRRTHRRRYSELWGRLPPLSELQKGQEY